MGMAFAFIEKFSGVRVVKVKNKFCDADGWADITVNIVFRHPRI